jgi:hypothetical protein
MIIIMRMNSLTTMIVLLPYKWHLNGFLRIRRTLGNNSLVLIYIMNSSTTISTDSLEVIRANNLELLIESRKKCMKQSIEYATESLQNEEYMLQKNEYHLRALNKEQKVIVDNINTIKTRIVECELFLTNNP